MASEPSISGKEGAPSKQKRTALTLETKLEILRRADCGEGSSALGRAFNLNESTIRTILRNADKIRTAIGHSTPLSAKITTKIRNPLLAKMEKMLSLYIEQETKKKSNLTHLGVRAKALEIYDNLSREEGIVTPIPFVASKGWLDKFIRRQRLHNLKIAGATANADYEAAGKFSDEFKALIKENGYSPKQVFNAVEIGLFWKRMPSKTYISKEERVAPGFKAGNDRLMLLLCTNAAGDCKMKPLLVYHSRNPCALKGFSKTTLPVHWRANKTGCMTGQVIEDWFMNHFAVEAEKYCWEANLAFKVLLILDSTPLHSPRLDTISPNIRVLFLPANTASLVQPLHQGVVSTFRAYYLHKMMFQILEDINKCDNSESKPTVSEWWKHYSIKNAIDNIQASWEEVKTLTVKASWKPLWSDILDDFRGVPCFSIIVQNIVEIGHMVGGDGFSDMEADDVLALINSHDDLNMNDLMDITEEQMEKDDVGDEENYHEIIHVKDMSMIKLASLLSQLDNIAQQFIDEDPNSDRSLQFRLGLDNIMKPYREIYAQKLKLARQISLKQHLIVWSADSESKPSTSCK